MMPKPILNQPQASHPVAAAVATMKADAIESAKALMQKHIASVLTKLAECGWDLHKYAPSPRSDISKADYRMAKAKQNFALQLTDLDLARHERHHLEPRIRISSHKKAQLILAAVAADTAAEYDSFVHKLVAKVGDDVVSATIAGNHVWGHSILTVTHTDGRVTRWKTQQIVNVSVLGKVFNQWPTRHVK